MSRYVLSPRAQEDLSEIYDYSVERGMWSKPKPTSDCPNVP